MKRLITLYRPLNTLSIDVAVGAVCSLMWLANIFEVKIPILNFITLGLTVWIIYTSDHLLDAKRISWPATTVRHRFHQINFRLLTTCVVINILLNIVLVFFLEKQLIFSGTILSFFVVIYLFLNKKLVYTKEFLVACLYTMGVLLPVVSITGLQVLMHHTVIVVSFFVTVCLNVILFSWYEHSIDKKEQNTSITVFFGMSITDRIIWLLFILQLGLIAYSFYYQWQNTLLLMLMNGVLLLLFLKRELFYMGERYRLIGDAIFLLPVFTFF